MNERFSHFCSKQFYCLSHIVFYFFVLFCRCMDWAGKMSVETGRSGEGAHSFWGCICICMQQSIKYQSTLFAFLIILAYRFRLFACMHLLIKSAFAREQSPKARCMLSAALRARAAAARADDQCARQAALDEALGHCREALKCRKGNKKAIGGKHTALLSIACVKAPSPCGA